MAVFRPTFWAVTYGNALRLNESGDDATLSDEVAGVLPSALAAAKAALAGNDGAP